MDTNLIKQKATTYIWALITFTCVAFFMPAEAAVTDNEKKKIETAVPKFSRVKPKKPRRLLLWEQEGGWKHGSVDAGRVAIKLMGKKNRCL